MSKHTPAPWSIDEATGHIIPSSGIGGGICDPWGDSIEQMEANARLIAAAPTMYNYLTKLASCGDNEAHAIITQIAGS